jgi:hypothetical protein
MGRDSLACERRTALPGHGDVLRHEALNGVFTHASTARTGKDRPIGLWWRRAQPCFYHLGDLAAQGCTAELPPLAVAANVGAGTERDVLAAEGGELRDAKAGLNGDQEKRAIAPPYPRDRIWGIEEGVDFLLVQELHDPAFETLAWDREDTLTEERVGGLRKGDIPEESVERREAGVAAASGVAALALKMVEELSEERGTEVGEHEAGGIAGKSCGGEAEQQTESVAVGGHRVRACAPLLDEPIDKEGLQKRGEIGGAHTFSLVARSVASRRSSGTASMYQ